MITAKLREYYFSKLPEYYREQLRLSNMGYKAENMKSLTLIDDKTYVKWGDELDQLVNKKLKGDLTVNFISASIGNGDFTLLFIGEFEDYVTITGKYDWSVGAWDETEELADLKFSDEFCVDENGLDEDHEYEAIEFFTKDTKPQIEKLVEKESEKLYKAVQSVINEHETFLIRALLAYAYDDFNKLEFLENLREGKPEFIKRINSIIHNKRGYIKGKKFGF